MMAIFVYSLDIHAPTPEACETECYVRGKSCQAWTFLPKESSESSSNPRRKLVNNVLQIIKSIPTLGVLEEYLNSNDRVIMGKSGDSFAGSGSSSSTGKSTLILKTN